MSDMRRLRSGCKGQGKMVMGNASNQKRFSLVYYTSDGERNLNEGNKGPGRTVTGNANDLRAEDQ